jgi:hypothetical protein
MYQTTILQICGMIFYLIYTKLNKAAIMRQGNFETAGFQSEYGAHVEEYLSVIQRRAYSTRMLTYTNNAKFWSFLLTKGNHIKGDFCKTLLISCPVTQNNLFTCVTTYRNPVE